MVWNNRLEIVQGLSNGGHCITNLAGLLNERRAQ